MRIGQRIAEAIDSVANLLDKPTRELDFSQYLCRNCNRYAHWWSEDRHDGWWHCMTDQEFLTAGITDHKGE